MKYKSYILEKSGLSDEDYGKVIATLFKHIKLVPQEEIEGNWDRAKKIMEDIDKEDVVFIATALIIPDSVLWSNDKDFGRQDKIKVLKTKELIKV